MVLTGVGLFVIGNRLLRRADPQMVVTTANVNSRSDNVRSIAPMSRCATTISSPPPITTVKDARKGIGGKYESNAKRAEGRSSPSDAESGIGICSANCHTDTRAIQSAFSAYKDALLQGDGAKAADVVSARTIGFYDGIVTHALKTPRAQLAGLDFISRFMVLRIRHEFTRSQISQMTGRELLATGVNKGWISKSSVANIERLVDIKVDAPEASASMPLAPGVPAFRFLKESGQWKLDLVASFALANDAMKQEITKAGLTEEEFILRALSALSGRNVDERIFSPPL